MDNEAGFTTGEDILKHAASLPGVAEATEMMELLRVMAPYQEVYQQVAVVSNPIYIVTTTNTSESATV